MSDKGKCTRCEAECHHLCYVNMGKRYYLVCVDCFGKVCRAVSDAQKKPDHRKVTGFQRKAIDSGISKAHSVIAT